MTITVKVKAIDESFEFDESTVPASATAFLLNYGYKQWLNDGAAIDRKKVPDAAEARVLATKRVHDRVNCIRSGDMPAPRGEADPATSEMRKVVAALLASGWSADQVVEALAKKKKAA